MWSELSKPWQICFEQAWDSYCNGSIPIGAVLVDENGSIILTGRNRINEKKAPVNQICYNKLAHAEMNVLLQIELNKYPDLKKYTLYTTMEPCTLCFGAIVMGTIRKVKYAARDKIAGSMSLIKANEFLISKSIEVDGPDTRLEIFQLVIKSDYILREFPNESDRLLGAWEQDCPLGVELGRKWHKEGVLLNSKNNHDHISNIIDQIEKEIKTNCKIDI